MTTDGIGLLVGLASLVGCGVTTPTPTPTVIASGLAYVESIVATSSEAYWTESGHDMSDLPVARVMHARGRAIDLVAEGQVCPFALATDQASVFWLRCDGALGSAPTTTEAASVLLPPGTFTANSFSNSLAVNDTIYITTDVPGAILAVSKQQGAAVTTAVANLAAPRALAVDDTNLYWLDATDAALYQRARQADATTAPTRLATLDTTSSITWFGAIATDGVHLYWSDADPKHAHAMRISDGARFELATSGPADAFALDASHVYWISRLAETIERAPLAGGTTEPVAVTNGPYPAAAIAVTDDAVIFADDPPNCDTTIMDCFPNTIESVPK